MLQKGGARAVEGLPRGQGSRPPAPAAPSAAPLSRHRLGPHLRLPWNTGEVAFKNQAQKTATDLTEHEGTEHQVRARL